MSKSNRTYVMDESKQSSCRKNPKKTCHNMKPKRVNLIESTLTNSERHTLVPAEPVVDICHIEFLNELKNRIPRPGKIYKSKKRVSYNYILKIIEHICLFSEEVT